MSYLDDILASINAQRAGLATGGAVAPAQAASPAVSAPAAGNGTGGAQAPAAAASAEEDRLQKALRTLGQNGQGESWKALERFKGKILGYGHHDKAAPGHAGRFAVVQRGGKLFHVYRDGTTVNVQEGAIARALGIPERQGALEVVRGPRRGALERVPDRDGGGLRGLPGLEAVTGGAQAPIVPRGALEMGDMEQDPSQVTYSRGGLPGLDELARIAGLRR